MYMYLVHCLFMYEMMTFCSRVFFTLTMTKSSFLVVSNLIFEVKKSNQKTPKYWVLHASVTVNDEVFSITNWDWKQLI